MKNTRVTDKATLDQIPRPNHIAKIGARMTRGMEFAALMNGSRILLAAGESPSHRPVLMPAAVPMKNASMVSVSVMPR